MKLASRFGFVFVAALCLLASLRAFSQASGQSANAAGFKREIYRVELDSYVTGKPVLAAAWTHYGELKAKWRSELFFERHPNENEYRYTFQEEYACRKALAKKWADLKRRHPSLSDRYLDNLLKVDNSRYFDEYIYSCFAEGSWNVNQDDFYMDEYKLWKKNNIKGPDKETHVKVVEVKLSEW